jgi:hypothetical protein
VPCVSNVGDMGGWAVTVLVCDLPSLAPLLPLPFWLGPLSAWPPWPLRAGECASPDCRRACFGALSGFPSSCGVLLLPLPPVAWLLVGNTDRGLGYGYRHQLVSAGSWIACWRRGLTQSFLPCLTPLSRLWCPLRLPPLRALHFLVGLVAAFSTRVAHPRSPCPLAEGGGGGGAGGGECGLMCGARVSKCVSFGRLHWWGLVAPQVRVSGLVLVPTAVCL